MKKLLTNMTGAICLTIILLAFNACGSATTAFKTGEDKDDVAIDKAALNDLADLQDNERIVYKYTAPLKNGLQEFSEADDELNDLDAEELAGYFIAKGAAGKEFNIYKVNSSIESPTLEALTLFAKVTAEPRLIPVDKTPLPKKAKKSTAQKGGDEPETSSGIQVITPHAKKGGDEPNQNSDEAIANRAAMIVLDRIAPTLSSIEAKFQILLDQKQQPNGKQTTAKKTAAPGEKPKAKKPGIITIHKGQKVRIITDDESDIYINNGTDLVPYKKPTKNP